MLDRFIMFGLLFFGGLLFATVLGVVVELMRKIPGIDKLGEILFGKDAFDEEI